MLEDIDKYIEDEDLNGKEVNNECEDDEELVPHPDKNNKFLHRKEREVALSRLLF